MPSSDADSTVPSLFDGVATGVQASVLTLSNRWRIDDAASHGANGYVFFGHNCITKQPVAIKYYAWLGASELHREPATLSRIQHPNVLQIEHAEVVDNEWALFVTPHLNNGD